MKQHPRALMALAAIVFAAFTSLVAAGPAQASTSWANLPSGNYLRADGAWVKPAYMTCQWKSNSAGTTVSIRCKAVSNNIVDAYDVEGGAHACTTSGCRNLFHEPDKIIYTDGAYHTIVSGWSSGGSVASGIVKWLDV